MLGLFQRLRSRLSLIARVFKFVTLVTATIDNLNLCTGDAVVHGAATATVVIEANDDANGIFSLEPAGKAVEEGNINQFQ